MINIKRSIFVTLVFFLSFGCTKDKDENDPDNPNGSTEIKTDYIRLQTRHYATGYDTTDNYLSNIQFSLNDKTQAAYTDWVNPDLQKYTIKYVGDVPLLSPDTLNYNTGEAMQFPINPALKGKKIFEVYSVADNKLVKTVVASADSCKIFAAFSVWANHTITVDQIRKAYHYYLTVKQTPAIRYYNTVE